MPVNVAMVQLDLRSSHGNKKFMDAKFVVVIGDEIDEVS
jgi:hypothetical protein